MTAGRVGKPHGRDGSFYVDAPAHPLPVGTTVHVGSARYSIARRAGTDARPLIRLSPVEGPASSDDPARREDPASSDDPARRQDPASLRGELLLVEDELAEGEWLAGDLVGCSVPGHGSVVAVFDGPSCSVLELSDGVLVPFVGDAIRSVEAGRIVVNEEFLG